MNFWLLDNWFFHHQYCVCVTKNLLCIASPTLLIYMMVVLQKIKLKLIVVSIFNLHH